MLPKKLGCVVGRFLVEFDYTEIGREGDNLRSRSKKTKKGMGRRLDEGGVIYKKGSTPVPELWFAQNPGEIKGREVSWTLTKKLVQKRSRARRWCWA